MISKPLLYAFAATHVLLMGVLYGPFWAAVAVIARVIAFKFTVWKQL